MASGTTDLEHICVGHTLKEVKTILDEHGMRHLELEFLTDWFVGGARRAESNARRRRLLEASAVLGAKHVKVGDFYSTPCPMPQLVEAFAGLCAEAEQYGATIGFDSCRRPCSTPWKRRWEMVETAGAGNGGLILDIVHIVNLGISYDQVSRIPSRYLIGAELNDGTLPSSPHHDPSGARRFCGDGEFDIKGFIAAVRKTGYSGPWAVEVFAEELLDKSLSELNRKAYETTMEQFAD